MKLKIKQVRQQKNITQKELATKMKLSQSVISDYERNIFIPSLLRIQQIAIILECTIDDLIDKTKISI